MVQVLSNILAGVTLGFLVIVLSISNGSLLFAGALHEHVPDSVGLSLFGALAMAVVASFTTTIRGGVFVVQELPAVGLSAVAVSVAGVMAVHGHDQHTFTTIFVAVAIATLACGALALLLGAFRLGGIVRFIPHSVIGGFLAGTGWLIILGGVAMITSEPTSLAAVTSIGTAPQLATAAAFVVTLVLTRRVFSHPVALPIVIVAVVMVFNAVVLAAGLTREDLRAGGWLIGLPASGALWPPFTPADFEGVDWRAVATGLLDLPTVLVVTVVSVLLNATGIEMDQHEDVHLNRELVTVGWMNLASGAGGGLPGFHSISLTALGRRIGVSDRRINIIIAALCALAIPAGLTIIDAIPAFVFGGILVWIGGQFVLEWLVTARRRVDRWEYVVTLLIFAAIVGFGFSTGIIFGLMAGILVFLMQYAQVDFIRHELTGSQVRRGTSALDSRSRRLEPHLDSILVFRLQGYLFFGMSDRLRRRISTRLHAGGAEPVCFLIIDFSRVTGLDTSTIMSFVRLADVAQRGGAKLLLAGADKTARAAFERGGLVHDGDGVVFVDDPQRALDRAEQGLLAAVGAAEPERPVELGAILGHIGCDKTIGARIAALCERQDVPPETRILELGSDSRDIYFVESGRASVIATNEAGGNILLATIGPGAVFGEIAFYLGGSRSASIVADEAMVIWRFSRASLDRLEADDRDAAMAFHSGMAKMLSRRVADTSALVRSLAD